MERVLKQRNCVYDPRRTVVFVTNGHEVRKWLLVCVVYVNFKKTCGTTMASETAVIKNRRLSFEHQATNQRFPSIIQYLYGILRM